MWARHRAPILLTVLTLAGCGSSVLPSPSPTSVTPSRGYAANATPVVIHGAGFSVRPVQPSSGGAPSMDSTFQAWLGDQSLLDVRRIDEQTLTATVPAGISPGMKTLRVQGPYGSAGELASAYTVVGTALASISAAISAAPATVSVGQPITVTLTVTNTGTTEALDVVPDAPTVSGAGTVGSPSGPDPAAIATLAPAASGTFTWIYPATGAGGVAFAGAASATDSFSGTTVRGDTDPAVPASVTVELPAGLAATFPASGAAAVGREFTVAMTVTNPGGAAATNVMPGAFTVAPASLAALKPGTGPVPAALGSLPAGASDTFTWTVVAGTTPGTVTFSSSASGLDANSGAPLASGTAISGGFVIGAAGLNATLSAAPATASVGQVITLTLTLANPGLADVRNLVVGTPSVSSTDGARFLRLSGPSPTPPSVLAAGGTITVAWTYSPSLTTGLSTGHLDFGLLVSGTDAFSGEAISAPLGASATVEAPAALAATLTFERSPPVPVGQPFTVNAGQVFTAKLSVSNTGVAAALAVTATPIAGCGAPSPVSATVNAGSPVVFTYASCSSTTLGTFTRSASASGTDANNPSQLVVSNTASASGTVQAPAVLVASLPASGAAAIGKEFTVAMTVTNTGGSAATNVLPGTLRVEPASLAALKAGTGPVPASLASLAAGASATFTWTLVAGTTPGTVTFSSSASGLDGNSGAPLGSGAATSGGFVIGSATMTATLSAVPATASVGQVITLTLTLSNQGLADVRNLVVGTPSVNSTDGARAVRITGPAPAPPSVLAAGGTITVAWTYSPSLTAGLSTGHLDFGLSVSGTDAFSGGAVTAQPGASVTVETPASLAATLTFERSPPVSTGQPFTVNVSQPFTARLSVSNTGAAEALSVTPTPIAGCAAPSPTLATVSFGSPVVFVYANCSSASPGTVTLSASASGTDSNDTSLVVTSNTASATATVQTPAVVTATALTATPATLTTGQGFTVTLALAKTGTAAANVTAATLAGVTCATPPTLPVNGAGASLNLTWSGCTAPATPGTLSITGSATWVAVNTGTSQVAAFGPVAVTVVAAATVTAMSIVSTPATLSTGQTFAISLTLSKSGGTIVNVTGASMDYAASCSVAPVLPVNAMASTLVLTWTGCTAPASPQVIATSGFATWVDASVPTFQNTTNSTSAAITVQAAAGLAVAYTTPPPAKVSVGQVFPLTVTLTNTAAAGGASVTGVVFSLVSVGASGAAAACTATVAGPTVIAAGGTGAFPYSCTGTATGTGTGIVTYTATATGTAANSNLPLAPVPVTSTTTVQTAAVVTATSLTATPSTLNTGQAFTVTLALAKTGTAAANVTAATLTGVTCTTAPTVPVNGIGASLNLTWSGCSSPSAGTLNLSASATWVDVNVGTPQAASSGPISVTVQSGAVVTATGLTATPSTLNTGRAFTVTLALAKTGTAAANVTAATLTGTTCTTPPTLPVNGVGASLNLTWSGCTAPATPQTLSLSASATWVDVNVGTPQAAGPALATVTVQSAAVVTATSLTATPSTLNTSQGFTVTLALAKTGTAAANVTAATLTGTTCTTPPTLPVNGVGASLNLTWSGCTAPATPQTLSLSASATWVDVNVGTPQAAGPALATVTVQSGAVVTATSLTATPSTLNTGQAFTVTLALAKTGTAAANVTAATLTGVTCTTAPTVPVNGIGASLNLTWSGCTAPATPQTLSLSASATWVDVNVGTPQTAGPALAAVTVQSAAAVTATSLTATPSTLNTGQGFTVTLALAKTGTAAANVTAATLTGVTCTTPPTVPVNGIGASLNLTWSGCTAPATPQTLSLSASATWVDVNVGTPQAASSGPTSVTVQSGAVVTATSLTATPSTLNTSQGFTVTLALAKTGTAAVNVTAVALTGTTCTTPPTMPVNGIGASLNLTWSGCTAPATPQTLSLSASATWVDVNVGTPQTAGPALAAVTVQSAAAVTATSLTATPSTLNTGQGFTVTLALAKTGTAAANVTAATLTGTTCTTPPTLPVNGVGASLNLTWSGCTAPATPQTLSLSASATWVDVNVGTPQTASPGRSRSRSRAGRR